MPNIKTIDYIYNRMAGLFWIGKYLGTFEVTQVITEIQKIDGEKRLLDEG